MLKVGDIICFHVESFDTKEQETYETYIVIFADEKKVKTRCVQTEKIDIDSQGLHEGEILIKIAH